MKSKTIEKLKSVGWYPSRKIDLSDVKQFLESKGYTITKSFIKFYEEFGNIGFNIDVNERPRSIQLDISIPVRYDYDSIIIEDYPKITETNFLTPIGNINGSSYLVIDENSVIYLLNDGNVMKLGDNAEETLDNLCNVSWSELRKQGEHPIPDWW